MIRQILIPDTGMFYPTYRYLILTIFLSHSINVTPRGLEALQSPMNNSYYKSALVQSQYVKETGGGVLGTTGISHSYPWMSP